ncbi:hypothetical protein NM688_g7245 [Phlebia brevispora]|uniref:Uncharacterized protein n=1 Tax=Phlebia brevispora TaxID=194682 RepID=A0ACC1S7H4_9APHY|nr:hypothetical protein NM688_g7245 [Phlebia brevispora]
MQIGPYTLQDLIHETSSCLVFDGIWSAENVRLAVKFSQRPAGKLRREYEILCILRYPTGIPDAIKHLVVDGWEVLVMEHTGLNLSIVANNPGVVPLSKLRCIFASVPAWSIFIEEVSYIVTLNRLTSPRMTHMTVWRDQAQFLISFSLACAVYEHEESDLIRCDMVIGSLLYMSPWVHKGYRPCRRDDLFSAAVTFLAFCKGEDKLHWYKVVHEIGDDAPTMEQHAHIASLKTTADLQEFSDLPPVFCQFYQYALALEFGEKPRYHTWFNMFVESLDGDFNNISPLPSL